MTKKQELNKAFTQEFWGNIPEIEAGYTSFIGSVIKSNENRLQALLAYCLDPNVPHEINDLFLEALLECIADKGFVFRLGSFIDSYEVLTEVRTEEDGRIDILLKTTEPWNSTRQAIIIEMKLDSILHNNLVDYFASVSDCREEHKVGVVLALNNIADTITHNRFIFISLHEYFSKIKDLYKRDCDSKIAINQHSQAFLVDFFNYVHKLKRNFLSDDIGNHMLFHLENREKVVELRSALKGLSENSSGREWYIAHKHHIDDIQKSINFVRTNLREFAQDWRKVNGRAGQTRREGLLYFFYSSRPPFSGIFRFALDYKKVLTPSFIPEVSLKLEISNNIDYLSLFNISKTDVVALFETKKIGLDNESDFNKTAEWTEVFKKTFYDKHLVIDFYNLFYSNAIPIIQTLEDHIYNQLIGLYQKHLSQFFIENTPETVENDNSELSDSIQEYTLLREPSDSHLVTAKWVGVNTMSFSVWTIFETAQLMKDEKMQFLIGQKDWVIHNSDDNKCYYKADFLGNGQLAYVFRNFTFDIVLSNIPDSQDVIKILSKYIFSIVSQLKRGEHY